MTKDVLLTILCCAVYLLAFGNDHTITRNRLSACAATCLSRDTVRFPDIILSGKNPPRYHTSDSTGISFYLITGPCKQFSFFQKRSQFKTALVIPVLVRDSPVAVLPAVVPAQKRKLIHGDVSYDYSAHTSPDTSFVGNNFNQHHVLANLYATLGKKYPVIFHFGTLQTSLPYVRNYVDFSLQFDHKQYNASMMDQFMAQIKGKMLQEEKTDSLLHNQVLGNFNQQQALSGWLNNDKQMQELMHSNAVISQYAQGGNRPTLASLESQAASASPLAKDSSLMNAMGNLEQIKAQASTTGLKEALSARIGNEKKDTAALSNGALEKAVAFLKEYSDKLHSLKDKKAMQDSLQRAYDSARSLTQARKDSLEKMINNGEAGELLKDYGDSIKPFLRFLMGIKKLTIGRSFIDYSQLSAKNISLLGFNMEYYDHYYFALAAGKTDFRYLDFLSVSSVANQYLLLGRIGLGKKEGRHLYLTGYTGKKQASYYIDNKPATNSVTGVTLETRVPLSKNIIFTGEIAKSSYPAYIDSATRAPAGKLLKFSDRNNEAYSFQLTGYFPKTDTRFSGVYNRLGIDFQSFNIFNNNANTSAWQVRVDQYFFKKKLFLSASARQNDFSTPFIDNNYKSQALFYSFQASVRLRKLPVLTLGFLPYAQITRINGELSVSRFYTLMGSANYAFRFRQLYMSSSLVYTRYFNNSNQVGFQFYDAQSWFLNHSVLLKRFTLSGSATVSYSPGYSLFCTGPGIQWRVSNTLDIGGGVKYNDLNNEERVLGYNGNINIQIGKLGKFGISFERGYIPGINDGLFQNDWGKATYNKNF